jgi:alkylhydroperoxidase family enzyme
MDIGSAVGRKEGVTEQQFLDLAHFESSPAFSPLEKLVLRYAEAVSSTPVDVSEELFQALQQHLNSAQLVELTSAIAWENYRARFNRPFGIEAEGFCEGAACVMPAASQRQSASGR